MMSPKEVARRTPGDALPADVDGHQTLELEAIQDEPVSALIARGAAYAREYADIEKKPTILAMNLATVLLALRRKHDDWLGRTHEYRQDAAEAYRQANIADRDTLTRLQATVRYHVGNALRRQLTPRELKNLELLDTSPLERIQDRRATDSAILRATKVSVEVAASTPRKTSKNAKGTTEEVVPAQAGGAGHGVKATADHLRLAHVAGNIVGQLDTDVIREHMTDGQRAKLDEELAALQQTVAKLRRLTRKSSSEA
ncbi:hypothetical protein [Streptomyces sp. NPDC060001]|uniref:hypothetical protein n=1 Tax=Streptomyces sp. NPDC060001 TaxID=3347032 RepID=UPI0036C4C1C1